MMSNLCQHGKWGLNYRYMYACMNVLEPQIVLLYRFSILFIGFIDSNLYNNTSVKLYRPLFWTRLGQRE